MGYHLFLDDERQPSDVVWLKLPDIEWVIVRNYNEFTKQIQSNGMPDFVSFDRDLADEHYVDDKDLDKEMILSEKTGEDCLSWLICYCLEKNQQFPKYALHTMNIIGKEKMQWSLRDLKRFHPELAQNII